MAGSFVADVLLGETNEVLQVPVVKAKVVKNLLAGVAPRVPLLGNSSVPTSDDTLEQFLQHVGVLFGRDPNKWEKVGDTKTDITEQDGKRIIKRTGMFTGTELHLFVTPPYYDPRLPLRPDQPQLEFAVQSKEVTSTAEWQQLIADQPWNSSRRRQLLLNFLQAKMEAEDEQLQLEGARGMWELSINKPHHAEMQACHLRLLVKHLQSANIEVARICAAAVWGLAVNERSRALLLDLGVVQVLLQVAQQSLELPCVAHLDHQEAYLAGGKITQAQRNQLQACVLGSLSVLIVDQACRRPLISMEPGLDTLFSLSMPLPGYADKAWAAARREAAAKAITSLVQRDHDARMQLMMTGGVPKLLALLDSKGPGHARVQFCVASVLAILVLDDAAMEVIKQRGEGHLVFEATLRLLSHVLTAVKFSLAVGDGQILSEGMTKADVAAAMQKLRNGSDSGGKEASTASLRQGSVTGADPLLKTAARRLSQETHISSSSVGNAVPLSRRISADAVAAATMLQEASRMSAAGSSSGASQQQSVEEEEEAPEPLDVQAAVSLAEACAQAMWGSAHYSLDEPQLHITQEHVIELGKLALDCLIISELDLGRVCHCLAATLASLASNEVTAAFIMAAPGDSVAKAMLTLLEVEDDEGFSNAGHVRAAASTCLAFLACHPLGARGDTCLTGPFRSRLLNVGAFGALLKAALASSADDPCDAIIQQTAAVGIMYMSTMAGAVDPAELAMYAALMTSNTNITMVEYLMAGMWILLKNPSNRQVLGGAFKVNPAASKLTQGMMNKLQDTIEVADVNEAAEKLSKVRLPGSKSMAVRHDDESKPSTPQAAAALAQVEQPAPAQAEQVAEMTAASAASSKANSRPESAAPVETSRPVSGEKSVNTTAAAATAVLGGPAAADEAEPDTASELLGRSSGMEASAAGHRPSIDGAQRPRSSGLLAESSFGALAVEADSMEDKLQLVQTKRRSVLFNTIAGSGHSTPRSQRASGAGAAVGAGDAADGQGSRIQEISEVLKEGPDSKRTLDTVKSMDRTLNRSLTNLDKQLGSQLEDNWGLDVLVRVGETWLPKMAEATGVPRGCSLQGVSPDAATQEAEAKADVPLLKLFEFLTASLCLYVIEEEPACPLHKTANVYSSARPPGVKSSPNTWWTVAAPMIQADAELSPLLHRTMHILLTVLHLRLPAAWKILQLSVVMLWNAAVQSANVERHQVCEGICSTLLEIVNSSLWPPTLRDLASGHLQFLMETHSNLLQMGQDFVTLVKTSHPLLELSGARGIARLCFAGSMGSPSTSQLLSEVKATAAAVGAIGVLIDLLRSAATKFLLLEDGGCLPPLPVLTHLVDKEYKIYEREINNAEGVLEQLTVVLAALLNLSTLRSNQPKIARRGLQVLLKSNTSLYQIIGSRDAPTEAEMKLLDMLAAIIQNMASHPDNRTHMYRAELAGTAALDRLLEGPASPEPVDTSTALLASRLTGAAAGSPGCSTSPSTLQQPRRCASPALGGTLPQLSSQAGDGAAAAAGTQLLSASLDSALSAATVLRPKVVFPPISRSNVGLTGSEQFRASSPTSAWPSPPGTAAAMGGSMPDDVVQCLSGNRGCRPSALCPPHGGNGTAHGMRSAGARSAKSRAATSVAGMPGSPIAAPDSREQFMIWMDSTFTDVSGDGSAMRAQSPQAAAERVSFRRQLWDENGEWLQPEPETSQALQRLLCRPLKHLWQDTPEARLRSGNARWAPAVSEYRQADLQYPLQHAAECMLTTAPPAEAADLLEATAQLTTMGRCDTGTMSLQRPSTRERQQGRIAMTVLEPAAGLLATNTADGAGSGRGDGQEQQQQQQVEPSTSRSGAGTDTWQQQATGRSQTEQLQQQQQEQQQTMGRAAQKVSLKVVLSPQRPRTIISFENKIFSSDGPGSRPVLTMFPHTEGAKVSKGLFKEYQLPNGRKAFMYYNSGSAMDEAEVPALWPPARPTTVPLALQQSMPLAQVLSVMAKPPGSAPPFMPWKPVPRLVPLPGSHTLAVARPELRDAASYGNLRADNLQLSITAQAIMRSQTTTTEESIVVAAAEEREPWTLPGSIFKPRVKEADARAFYDGGATLDKMFERDWQRACAKEKFTSMLARENKSNAAGKSDKQALQEVHDMLKRHYQVFYSTFVFYSNGGNDPYHMSLNAFTTLLDDAGIPDPDSLSIKRSDCDTIFIVCNFQPDKNSPDVAVNDEHAMMRFEFMECIVRLAIAKYGKGQSTDDLALAVELLFERNLLPRLNPMAALVSNDFRTERLYTEEVDLLLKQHQGLLKALYSRYRLKPSGGGLRSKVLKLDGWLALMADARLVDSQFTLADASLAFLWSRMFVIDEVKDYSRYTCLTFVDFLEALGRVADAKSLPTASDLDAAGYPSILEWALDKERLEGSGSSSNNNNNGAAAASAGAAPAAASDSAAAAAGRRTSDTAAVQQQQQPLAVVPANPGGNLPDIFRPRMSARFGAPKPRPLYAKLELLLDLIFRRLYWDPAQPESAFSYDVLLRMVKKNDKDMGP
ncbi:hypothetical protein OEZ85_012136 [Tetradesmus obliquus]|uniref:Uncharacterized protein n=1 Tax=Tetradesmus obliquus TaxID=3088 RepID=A0ABY8TSE9_TETOB|nr:hypothetical protein OEZ85_012136 [Tetradesmus obliquus]